MSSHREILSWFAQPVESPLTTTTHVYGVTTPASSRSLPPVTNDRAYRVCPCHQSLFCSLSPCPRRVLGMSHLAQKWVRFASKGTNYKFFNPDFSDNFIPDDLKKSRNRLIWHTLERNVAPVFICCWIIHSLEPPIKGFSLGIPFYVRRVEDDNVRSFLLRGRNCKVLPIIITLTHVNRHLAVHTSQWNTRTGDWKVDD